MPSIKILSTGYSRLTGIMMEANCTCTLVKDNDTIIIVDTMTAWDKDFLLNALEKEDVVPDQVEYIVNTHPHSDHCGNNNLFTNAKYHIVGDHISNKDKYLFHNFEESAFQLTENIEIIKTNGHTPECVSIVVRNCQDFGTVVIAGDLFEREEDVEDESLFISAGSWNCDLQRINRLKVAKIADYIVPGHGPIFQVTPEIIEKLSNAIR